MRRIFIVIAYVLTVILFIPASVTFMLKNNNKSDDNKVTEIETKLNNIDTDKMVTVYNPETEIESNVVLEDYIKGVVAAEMPVSFEIEALKAQAVAARTYALKHIQNTEKINAEDIGQAYISIEEMKKRWGDNFDIYYKKVSDAVDATKNEIIVYNNEPIEAVFHSTSAGMTETAENVWKSPLPYIKSVDSSYDVNAPDFEYKTTVDINDFIKKIKSKNNSAKINSQNIMDNIKIISRTQAGYVSSIKIGGISFTGIEIRQLFSLRSSNFTISSDGKNIIFTTKGYGHGAGMSQYGANFMAKEGKTYKEIINHYYFDVEIRNIS